jgi:hypothetical protein
MALGVGLTEAERQELSSRADNPILGRVPYQDIQDSDTHLAQPLPLVLEATPVENQDDGTDKIPNKAGQKKNPLKKTSSQGKQSIFFVYYNAQILFLLIRFRRYKTVGT